MMNLYQRLYSATSKFILCKHCKLFSDINILIASGYLMIKKFLNFSISGWLHHNAFHQPLVIAYVYFTGFILILAIIIKILIIVFENFPPAKHLNVEPEQISSCIQAMNLEILSHLKRCDSGVPVNIKKLSEQHSFEINTRLIVEALAEYIRNSINSIKVKRKDLFISLYTFDKESNELVYVLHYDPKRDIVASKRIPVGDYQYRDYECIKCIKSTNTAAYILDNKKYAKGTSKRHKTIKHYMGSKLETNGTVFGFLNIEFHNHSIFIEETSMQDFMEENVFPFKLLLEYQYLKQEFFNRFEEFEKYWRVT
jgi:hypothetical protein